MLHLPAIAKEGGVKLNLDIANETKRLLNLILPLQEPTDIPTLNEQAVFML